MKKYLLFIIMLLMAGTAFGQLSTINVGTAANSGNGDPLRTAFIKCNHVINMLDTLKVYELNSRKIAILKNTTITATDLNNLSGSTGNIQTQLNAKAPINSPTITGTATIKSIVGNVITADNGSLLSPNGESITLTPGNPYTKTYVKGGNLILKSGSAVLGGSTTKPGSICLAPGRGWDYGNPVGFIELGDSTNNNAYIETKAIGSRANIGLALIQKGTGSLDLGATTGSLTLNAVATSLNSSELVFTKSSNMVLHGLDSPQSVYNLTIRTGNATSSPKNTGNIYLYGGNPYSDGVRGGIYFGDGTSIATLPLKDAETNVVYYNTTTGKLSYGTAASAGSMTWPSSGGLAVYNGTDGWSTSITDNSTNWNTAYTDRLKWDGGSTGLTAATGRTSLGATTVGGNIFTLTNPGAVTFLRLNANNTVTARTAAELRSDLSLSTLFSPLAGSSSVTTLGTVTTGIWNSTAITDTYISSAATWNAKMANPMTTAGDIIYGGTSGAPTRLAKGTDGQVFTMVSGTPTWATSSGSMTWPSSGGLMVYSGSNSYGTSITDNHTNWDAAYTAVSNASTLGVTATELNWNKNQKSYAVEKADTTTLFVWNVGVGAVTDTACFRTAYSYGGFFWSGADTLKITKMESVLTGSSPSVAVDIYWHSTYLSSSATKLKTTAPTVTSTTTGDAVTSFDNYLIPPGVWVWCKTPTVTTQPRSMIVSLIGNKQNRKR